MNEFLSKSQYTRFRQCPKLYWLSINDRKKLSEPDAMQRLVFSNGDRVGEVAKELFPDGIEIHRDLQDITEAIDRTKDAVEGGETVIYEAAFLFDGVFVAVDILSFQDDGWHIYEVKSSTGIKDIFYDDAAIQYHVVQSSGLSIGGVHLVNINKSYTRDGDLDIQSLFSISDVTGQIAERVADIPVYINSMKTLLLDEEPHRDLGRYCDHPYRCAAHDYCWNQLAGLDPTSSVFTLAGADYKTKFVHYRNGIRDLSQVPIEDCNTRQRIQIESDEVIDATEIRKFVKSLSNPISHLDFESYQTPIPEFDGMKPYQQIPFQYSIHIEANTGLIHKEHLASSSADPHRSLAIKLLQDLPESGTILTYSQRFEKSIIKKLAIALPDLKPSLMRLINRIDDLMKPFQNLWYYTPEMNGKYSIKKVLPALVPGFENAYADLPLIHNGGEATAAWSEITQITDERRKAEIRSGLLEYCELDTLAMVKILEVLRSV